MLTDQAAERLVQRLCLGPAQIAAARAFVRVAGPRVDRHGPCRATAQALDVALLHGHKIGKCGETGAPSFEGASTRFGCQLPGSFEQLIPGHELDPRPTELFADGALDVVDR